MSNSCASCKLNEVCGKTATSEAWRELATMKAAMTVIFVDAYLFIMRGLFFVSCVSFRDSVLLCSVVCQDCWCIFCLQLLALFYSEIPMSPSIQLARKPRQSLGVSGTWDSFTTTGPLCVMRGSW